MHAERLEGGGMSDFLVMFCGFAVGASVYMLLDMLCYWLRWRKWDKERLKQEREYLARSLKRTRELQEYYIPKFEAMIAQNIEMRTQ